MGHPEANKLRAGIIAASQRPHHGAEPSEQAEKCGPTSKRADFSQFFKGLKLAITTRGVGAQAHAARKTFFSTWHSWSPCIANGTHYLGIEGCGAGLGGDAAR